MVAVDLRGRGRSGRDPSAESYRLEVYVEDLFTIIDALSLEPTVVIGTSLGGMVAMRMGAAAPGRVGGLVLNDIGPDVAPQGAGADRLVRRPPGGGRDLGGGGRAGRVL